MDTSLFDNIYSEWSKEIPDIIRNYVRNDKINGRFVDEADIISWINLLLQDSTKYDILMWLKAKENTSFVENSSIPFTESTIKQLYLVNDESLLKRFRDGKKRRQIYYIDKLFNYALPPFFMCMYSIKHITHYNPYCRDDCDVDLDSFFALKDDLERDASLFLDKIPDDEIKKCQEITMAFYLENTYGFTIKKMIAQQLSYIPIDNTIYQPDYLKSLAKKVIVDFFQEKSLPFDLPEKYRDLDIGSFRKLVMFFSRSDYDILKEAVTSHEYDDITLNSQNTPDPGYLLMVLLFAKSVLSYHLKEISKCMSICPNIVNDDFPESLQSSRYIASETYDFIDKMLEHLSFSMPGDKSITIDEKFLLADIKNVSTVIKVEKEGYSRNPDFKKKLHAKARNEATNEVCDIQELLISCDDDYPKIYMPSEKEILDRMKRYYTMAMGKVVKYRFLHSRDKKIKRIRCVSTRISKDQLVSNTPIISPPKLSGTEIRTCKNLFILLMNNCFNNPTIAEHNYDSKLNYVVQELPTQSQAVVEKFTKQKISYSSLNDKRFLLISLRNTVFCSPSPNISLNFQMFYKKILNECLNKLYDSITSEFNSSEELRTYISGIYNSEVLEHAKKNLCVKGKIDCSRISKEVQKRIIELN